MIYLKTLVSDGIYSVKCYDDSGVDKTSEYSILSKIYRKDGNTDYTLLLETTQNTLELHPDIFETSDNLYVTVIIDDVTYKTYLKTQVINETSVLKYTILYKSQTPLVEVSTPFLDRFNYFMPRWSTAYKNDVSNYSKITYPLFANIEKAFFKTSHIVSDSLVNKTTTKKVTNYRQKIGKVVGSDGVERKFTYNIENSPITRVKEETALFKTLDFKRINVEDFTTVINFKKKCSRLYIESPLNTTVTITGLTENNVVVTEDFEFNTLVVKQSKQFYRKIFHFESSSKEAYLSNYLDCTKTHLVEKAEKLPAFIDSAKEQQFPLLELNDNLLKVRFVREGLFEYDAYAYNLNKTFKSAFITDTLDFIGIDTNNKLFTGILKKNIEVNMPLLDNNNNNPYVFVASTTNDSVTFSVKTQDIMADLETNIVTIQIQTDKGTYYIDSNTEQFTDKPVNYFLDSVNSLEFTLGIVGKADFVSVIVSTDKKRYQASYRSDNITLTERAIDIDSLQYINDELYIERQGVFSKLVLLKDYYETALDNSLVTYEDDLTVYSLKGVKIDG